MPSDRIHFTDALNDLIGASGRTGEPARLDAELRGRDMSNELLAFLPQTFVVIDFETTGLNPRTDLIIETAAIRYTLGETNHAGHNCLIKIGCAVPAFITSLTGISSEMLDADGHHIHDALESLMDLIGEHRVVTFNAEFDLGFLNAALARAGKPKISNPFACALQMARRAWPHLSSHKLAHLAQHMGIETVGAHRALKDCELAIHVYIAAARQLRCCR